VEHILLKPILLDLLDDIQRTQQELVAELSEKERLYRWLAVPRPNVFTNWISV